MGDSERCDGKCFSLLGVVVTRMRSPSSNAPAAIIVASPIEDNVLRKAPIYIVCVRVVSAMGNLLLRNSMRRM